MKQVYFITGTDTGVGKTLISCALLHLADSQGKTTLGLKPIAAGCEDTGQGWQNEDALALMQNSSITLPYQQINPIALKMAIAPHIAAANEGKRLSVSQIEGYCRGALLSHVDFAVVEGAGGWRVPLNQGQTMADLAKALVLPVIVVVGMRLGCLNHALLTVEAIARDGLKIAGWVASTIERDMPELDANIGTLRALLPFRFLGHVPYLDNVSTVRAAEYIQLPE